MNCFCLFFILLSCSAVLTSGSLFQNRRNLTPEQQDEAFEELISDLSDADQQRARDIRTQMQMLVGDSNPRDLDRQTREQIRELRNQLRELLQERPRRHHQRNRRNDTVEAMEARFEELISTLSDEDKTRARTIYNEMRELIGDNNIGDLDNGTRDQIRHLRRQYLVPGFGTRRGTSRRAPRTREERQERFEEILSHLSDNDQIAAREIQSQLIAMLGNGTVRDLDASQRELYHQLKRELRNLIGEARHHFHGMSQERREEILNEAIANLTADEQETIRSIRNQISELIGDSNFRDLDDETQAEIRDLHRQLRGLLPRRETAEETMPRYSNGNGNGNGSGNGIINRNSNQNGNANSGGNNNGNSNNHGSRNGNGSGNRSRHRNRHGNGNRAGNNGGNRGRNRND